MEYGYGEHILMGRGGANPGLVAYNLFSAELTEVLSLGQGESVYSIDVCPDTGTVALGTRSGKASVLLWPTSDQDGDVHVVEEIAGSVPILSLCFVAASTLAIADAHGSQFLWRIGQEAQPDRLASGEAVVYALFHIDSNYLAGLSMSGELLIWDLLTRKIVDTVTVPTPPDCAALVHPQYWRHEDLWVWPGRAGTLVYYGQKQQTVQTTRGHAGDLYVVTVCGSELITVGATDRRLKKWRRGCKEPVCESQLPDAIISAAVWDWHGEQILLVNESGRAGLYSRSNEQLELVRALPGEDYRVILGPDPARFESARQHHQAEKARQLVERAEVQIARDQWDEFESLCQQLTVYGYPHVTWALRGRRARMHGDLLEELTAYHELAQVIPHDNDGSRDALLHYAALLESVWQLREALGLYQPLQIARSNGDGYAEKIHRLSDYLDLIESQQCVIEAGLALPLLVRSAMVLGRKVTGRYQLLGHGPTHCQVPLSIDEVMERYACLLTSKPEATHAEKTEFCWLSKDMKEQTPAIVLRSADRGHFPSLELAIKFFDVQGETVLVATIVLNADVASAKGKVEQHNEAILDQLRHVDNGPLLNSWRHTVYHDMRLVIRQLVTRGLAQNP